VTHDIRVPNHTTYRQLAAHTVQAHTYISSSSNTELKIQKKRERERERDVERVSKEIIGKNGSISKISYIFGK